MPRRNQKDETEPTQGVKHATVSLDALTPHPRNYRRHPEQQVARLGASLARFGQVRSIVVQEGADGRYLIVAGHGLAEAARQHGLTQLHADIIPATWTPQQVEGYLIADNESSRTADDDLVALAAMLEEQQSAGYDLEALGYSQEELAALLEQLADDALAGGDRRDVDDPDGGGDDFDTTPDEDGGPTRCQPGDIWQLGAHRLCCGDSTRAEDVARLMAGETARLVVSSPPYPGADMWDDLGAVAEVERIGLDALRRAVSVLGAGCVICWNIANTPIGTRAGVVHTTTTTKIASEELGLLCYGEIIWAKPVQHLTPLAFMMRPCVPNLTHEYVMIFYNGPRKQRENTSGLSDDDKTTRVNSVWAISPASATELEHKAPYPLELPRRCIALWSLEGDVVYEPFCGAGTTVIAAERMGRKCYGIEIDPRYCDVILRRWEAETGREAVRIEEGAQHAEA